MEAEKKSIRELFDFISRQIIEMDFLDVLFIYCLNRVLEEFLEQMPGFLESSLPWSSPASLRRCVTRAKQGLRPWVTEGCLGTPCRGRGRWGLLERSPARALVTRLLLPESKHPNPEHLPRKLNCLRGTVVKFPVDWNVHLRVTKLWGFLEKP